MRTGVGSLTSPLLHGYSRKQEATDGVAGALHGIVLSVQMQTQGRMLSLSQQSPQRGGAEPSVLVNGEAQGA